jgi:hypothetical protein
MTEPTIGDTVRKRPCAVVTAVLLGLLLSACTAADDGDSGPGASPSAASAGATPEATLVSFELPQEWVVQPLEATPGTYAPDSLHYAVRTPEGTTAAEFHSGIITPGTPCPDAERTPYYVIGSEPLALTDQPAATPDIEPRFVVRLITGFRFFGAYGVTDEVGGADGLACSLSNTVQGSEALGRFSFGDLEVLAPKAPANTGPQTVSFGTIGEAEEYYARPEFATVREMIRSVEVAEAPAG